MRELIDPIQQAFEKRKHAVKKVDGGTELLCVDFRGTMMEQDIRKRTDLPQDTTTGAYPYRFKIDNKSLDPEERAAKGLPAFDFSDSKAILKSLGEQGSFDMPLWILRKAGRPLRDILQFDLALTFQSKGCNLHDWTDEGGCTYCFVDAQSNNPTSPGNQVWLRPEYVIKTALELRGEKAAVRKGREVHRIRHSGGEPTTELDFTLGMVRQIEKDRIEDLYVTFDTNLSTGEFVDEMINAGIYERDILEQLAAHKVCVYAAFKGCSDVNIQRNTQARLTVDDQLYMFEKLVNSGLDVYPCIYNPEGSSFYAFLDKLNDNVVNATKRLRVEPIKWDYGPTKCRLQAIANSEGVTFEEIENRYREEEARNYKRSENIMKLYFEIHFPGVEYKQFDRTQVRIGRRA
ncbi:MAG: radical SAM protein [Candidatus Aenigmarchaeota archaeon]|nr:radical SAM protein [Candidatus Aenigmarchaeota archaeon]